MAGTSAFQPSPNKPFPEPELYARFIPGVNPFLPGEKGRGIERSAVPFAELTENFSSIDWIAPPPLGSKTEGIWIELEEAPPVSFRALLIKEALSLNKEFSLALFPSLLEEDVIGYFFENR
jgi:hypothetical protein